MQVNAWDWVLRVGLLIATSFVAWNTSMLIDLQKTASDLERRVSITESTRYTPKDRLSDLQDELMRYDRMTSRVDDLTQVVAEMSGDVKELRAIMLRVEEELRKDRP